MWLKKYLFVKGILNANFLNFFYVGGWKLAFCTMLYLVPSPYKSLMVSLTTQHTLDDQPYSNAYLNLTLILPY